MSMDMRKRIKDILKNDRQEKKENNPGRALDTLN